MSLWTVAVPTSVSSGDVISFVFVFVAAWTYNAQQMLVEWMSDILPEDGENELRRA